MTSVLAVDDSRPARIILKRALQAVRPDWRVSDAGGAEEALALINEAPFDIFFIDVNMPGMDGLTLTSKIRERFPDTPIALVTANIQTATKEQAASLAADVIGKPINAEKLTTWLEKIDG